MLKHDLNMEDTNRHVKWEGRKLMRLQAYTENYRQLKNAEWENSPSQGRAHQLVTQYPVCIPENVRINKIVQTEEFAFIYPESLFVGVFLIACVRSCPYSRCLCYWRNELFCSLLLTLCTFVIWEHFTWLSYSLSLDKSLYDVNRTSCANMWAAAGKEGASGWLTAIQTRKTSVLCLFSLEINNLFSYLPTEVLFLTSFSFSLGSGVGDWTLGPYTGYISTVP